jgi:hypothetical protein
VRNWKCGGVVKSTGERALQQSFFNHTSFGSSFSSNFWKPAAAGRRVFQPPPYAES